MLHTLIPTRGRPESVHDIVESFKSTCTISTTRLSLVIDQLDPSTHDYEEAVSAATPRSDHRMIDRIGIIVVEGGTMVKALNEAALMVVADHDTEAIGFLGDDHRPRTIGWDAAYLSALREIGAGVVYGNDLLQYDFVPTQCAMSAEIIRRIGWMAHPSLRHMYVDTLWRDMAREHGTIRYLPDIVVEHLHYINGKAVEDEGYRRVNASEVYARDQIAFSELHSSGEIRRVAGVIREIADEALGRGSV